MSAAAGVTQSIFISAEGVGYWCGEGMGELKAVRTLWLIFLAVYDLLYCAAYYHTHPNAPARTAEESIHWQLPYHLADEIWSADEYGKQWKVSDWHSNTTKHYPSHNLHVHTLIMSLFMIFFVQ